MSHFGDWDEMLILSPATNSIAWTFADCWPITAEPMPTLASPSSRSKNNKPVGWDLESRFERTVIAFHEKPKPDQLRGLETEPELFQEFQIEAAGRPYLASMGIYVLQSPDLEKTTLADQLRRLRTRCLPQQP